MSSASATLGVVLKWLCFVALIVFVGDVFRERLASFDWSKLHPDLSLLWLAILTWSIVGFLQVIGLRFLTQRFVTAPTWRQTATIAWIPLIGKYIPGKVASTLSGVWLFRRFGIDATHAVFILLTRTVLTVLVGSILATPAVLLLTDTDTSSVFVSAAIVSVAALVVLHPAVLRRFMNLVFRLSKQSREARVPSLRDYAPATVVFILNRLVAGTLFWVVASSISGVSVESLPILIAVASLASTAGLLAFFAPAGLGVQEGVLLLALDSSLGAEGPVIILVFRLAEMLRDGVFALLGMLAAKGLARSTANESPSKD